jgi:hypothetical protein
MSFRIAVSFAVPCLGPQAWQQISLMDGREGGFLRWQRLTPPALTLFALKKLMFHSRTNGLEAHLIGRGRRVYFDEAGFAEWLRCRGERRGGSGSAREAPPEWVAGRNVKKPDKSASNPDMGPALLYVLKPGA